MRPERRHTLCASLRSGNALQHVTRATPYGAPRSGTGLYIYRKNPSVWTDCLGNQQTDSSACKRVTSGLLDLSLARAHGHPGTTRSTGTRAHGHNPDPRAHGQGPPEDNTQAYRVS